MAGSVNKVILVGNLGRDPEVRYTPSGLAVANFSIATSETWTNKEGEKETRAEWHRIVAFGADIDASLFSFRIPEGVDVIQIDE